MAVSICAEMNLCPRGLNGKKRARVEEKTRENGDYNCVNKIVGKELPSCPVSSTTSKMRSSVYRGVTKHKWTGRYEAHLWDKNAWNTSQNKKGKQVYLGAYDEEESAARAYDLAAIKYWGPHETRTNFPVGEYAKDIDEMQKLSKEEYLASLRRRSSGFSRGVSKYRGVARHHHNGRWEARIGRVFGNKYLYLGTYNTEEGAAAAYDMAAIEYRGLNAVTNFDLSRYIRWLRPGFKSVQPSQVLEAKDKNGVPSDQERTHREYKAPSDANANNIPAPPTSSFHAKHPTALGLLVQSSVFRDMVEKESQSGRGDTGGHDKAVMDYFNRQESPMEQKTMAAAMAHPDYSNLDIGRGNLFPYNWDAPEELEQESFADMGIQGQFSWNSIVESISEAH